MNETSFPQTFELIKGLAVFKHSIGEFVITHKIVKKSLDKSELDLLFGGNDTGAIANGKWNKNKGAI